MKNIHTNFMAEYILKLFYFSLYFTNIIYLYIFILSNNFLSFYKLSINFICKLQNFMLILIQMEV